MPKLIARFATSWSEAKTSSLLLGSLLVLLNATYFGKMTFPVDEAKWLLLQVLAPALALFYVVAAMLRPEKIAIKITSFQIGILLLFAWAAISGGWALNQVTFPASLLDMSSLVIVLLFFSVALHAPDQRLSVFFLLLFSAMVAGVGILQYFGLDGDLFHQYARPASFFVNKNYASPIIAATLPLLGLTMLAAPPGRKRLLLLAVFQLNFTYLLISVTKSSWLAYFGSMAVFAAAAFNTATLRKHFDNHFLVKNLALIASGIGFSLALSCVHDHGPFPPMRREFLPQVPTMLSLAGVTAISPLLTAGLIKLWRRAAAQHRFLPLAGLLVIVLAGVTTCSLSRPAPILEQINALMTAKSTYMSKTMTESWTSRLPVWLNSLAMVRDQPIQGVGLGSFEAAYPLYHNAMVNDIQYTQHLWIGGSHNDPLQMLAELGLIGFTLAALCLVMLSRYFLKLIKTAAPANALLLTGCYLGGLALALESLFNPVLHQPSTLLLLAFFIGIIHAALYRDEQPARFFIFRREIAARQRFLCLAPLAIFFFLMLSISTPWAVRRYQAFVRHKEAVGYLNANQEDACYAKLREAVSQWPYSSTLLSETAAESYLYLHRHFTAETLQQAQAYNRQALRALPYHYNTNRIRIALLKDVPNGRSEIANYAPLLLKVAPNDKLAEAQREINF